MKANSNTVKGVVTNFRAGYDMLPGGAQGKVREAIMDLCGWKTTTTFYNKRRGTHKIKPPEVRIIEECFSQYNINPWTGQKLAS